MTDEYYPLPKNRKEPEEICVRTNIPPKDFVIQLEDPQQYTLVLFSSGDSMPATDLDIGGLSTIAPVLDAPPNYERRNNNKP